MKHGLPWFVEGREGVWKLKCGNGTSEFMAGLKPSGLFAAGGI